MEVTVEMRYLLVLSAEEWKDLGEGMGVAKKSRLLDVETRAGCAEIHRKVTSLRPLDPSTAEETG